MNCRFYSPWDSVEVAWQWREGERDREAERERILTSDSCVYVALSGVPNIAAEGAKMERRARCLAADRIDSRYESAVSCDLQSRLADTELKMIQTLCVTGRHHYRSWSTRSDKTCATHDVHQDGH